MSAVSLVFNVGKTLRVAALWASRAGLVELAIGLATLNVLQALPTSFAATRLIAHAQRDAADEPGDAAPLLRPMLRYCLPLLGARAAFLSGQNLGKLTLALVLDATTLGYYSFAFQTVERFVELVHTLPASLLPSLTQLVTRREQDRLRHIFDQAFRLIQLTACVLSFLQFAFAHELTLWHWMSANQFSPCSFSPPSSKNSQPMIRRRISRGTTSPTARRRDQVAPQVDETGEVEHGIPL